MEGFLAASKDIVAGAKPFAFAFGFIHIAGRMTAPTSLDRPTRAYWSSCIASTFHGIGISFLAWEAMVSGGFWSSEDLTLTTPSSIRCCHIYIGYLAADLVPLIYFGAVTKSKAWKGAELYLVHHLLSLWSWGLMVARGHLHAVAVGLLLLEATAPFTNGRWFLATLEITKGTVYTINGVAMALSFLVFRVVLMGYILVRYVWVLREPFSALPLDTRLTVLSCYAFGYPLQLFWFQKIAKGLLKVLKGGSTKAAAATPGSARVTRSKAKTS